MDPAIIARETTSTEEWRRRLERLQQVCHTLSSTRDLTQALPLLCHAVRSGLGFDRVALYRIDERAQQLVGPLAEDEGARGRGGDGATKRGGEGETGRGSEPKQEHDFAGSPGLTLAPSPPLAALELRREAGPITDVALGVLPYWLGSGAALAGAEATWAGLEVGAPAAVVPLQGRGEIVGLMLVSNRASGRPLACSDIEALRPFADQAGLAIADAAFAAESRRRVRFLSSLLQISTSLNAHSDMTELLQGTCDRLLEVLGLEVAAVYLLQEDRQTLRLHTCAAAPGSLMPALPEFSAPFRLGERLAGRAGRERLVIVNRNIQQDASPAAALARRIGLQSVVCAPLLLRGDLLGVLAAGTVHDLELTGEETDLIASVANQLSAAIANVRLLEETHGRMEEHRRRRDDLTVLYGISRAMVATLGIEERLRVIAEGLTEATRATRCAIFRCERGGLLPWVSYGDTVEEKQQFRALEVAPAHAARLLQAVSARRPPVVMRTLDEPPFTDTPWLWAWGVRSALWLPLSYQEQMTGLAVVYQPGEERPFPADQVELAAAVANQAAIAIRMSQAYEHERNVAETLHRSFIPEVNIRLRNFDLGHTYRPALQDVQVGGDFYDLFSLPDGQIALLMADVSGKGLPAALQTAMVKYMLRAYAAEDPSPAPVLERLNRGVCTFLDPDLFITAFYARLCPVTGQMQYGNAGHDTPLLALKEHDYCTALDVTGPALGLDPTVSYFTRTLSLDPGDLLLLYTDGITNAARRAPGPKGGVDELFGRERLEELLARLAGYPPDQVVQQIYDTVLTFAAGNLQDDCALLALKAKDVWK